MARREDRRARGRPPRHGSGGGGGTRGGSRVPERDGRYDATGAKAALVHRFPVQVDVEALDLLFVGHAQADQRIDDLEEDEGGDGAPGDADQAAPELGQDLAAIAVDQAASCPRRRSPRRRTRRSGWRRRSRRCRARRRRRANRRSPCARLRLVAPQKQTRPATMPITSAPIGLTKPEAGVMATRPATAPEMMPSTDGLPRVDPLREHPGQRRRRGGELGDGHRHAGIAAGADCRAGIEAEPADPQQRGADHRVDQVVRRHVLGAEALALAEHQGADQAGDAGVDVHHGAAGEVEHAPVAEEAAAPHPVGDRRVDDQRPQRP